MLSGIRSTTLGIAVSLAIGLAPSAMAADQHSTQPDRISREVRHELVLLPYYGVFDNLAFQVNGGVVTLLGAVTRPTLKSDAENAVKQIEGVTQVNNNIEVLPWSPMDDQIRRAAFEAIYGSSALDRYRLQAVPSIHIIVKDGHIVLEGAVATKADHDTAGIRANTVPNVFSVDNRLQIEP
jgi:hyperosmotically inducible protein